MATRLIRIRLLAFVVVLVVTPLALGSNAAARTHTATLGQQHGHVVKRGGLQLLGTHPTHTRTLTPSHRSHRQQRDRQGGLLGWSTTRERRDTTRKRSGTHTTWMPRAVGTPTLLDVTPITPITPIGGEASTVYAAGHRKNKRASNLPKHEKGDTRRGRDKGGEKGDQRRPFKKGGKGRGGKR